MFGTLPIKSVSRQAFPGNSVRCISNELMPGFHRMRPISKEDVIISWLEGYNSRYVFVLDHTKIDDDLTHFPVPVVLNGTDNLDIFNTLDGQISGDSFDGIDGDPPDSDLWAITDISASGTAQINSNKLRISIPNTSADEQLHVDSIFKLDGDFDVQVDYSEISSDAPSSSQSYPVRLVAFFDSGENYWFGNIFRSTGEHNCIIDGSNETGHECSDLFTTGKFRMVRSNGNITVYFWSGSQWEWDGNSSGFTYPISDATDCQISLFVHADFDSGVTADFSNFQINSGTVIWPENTNPDHNKIALTKDDGITQLYGEVEQWDSVSKKITLWISKEDWIISGTEDLLFYLYYDSEIKNDQHIAFSGNRPEVWNPLNSMILNMNQDPTLGSNCILDSTINGNNGTPTGLTLSDLTDGDYLGKELNFNGSTSKIDTSFSFPTCDDYSYSFVFKTDTTVSSERFTILRSRNTAAFDNIYMFIDTDHKLYVYDKRNNISAFVTSDISVDDSQNYVVHINAFRAGGLDLYINGLFVSTVSLSDNAIDMNDEDIFHIGYESADNNEYFDGSIENVKIRIGVPFTEAEIKADYYAQLNQLSHVGIDPGSWEGQYEYEVNKTKIDSDLTHFPVPIILNGTANADFFEELSGQITGDDFIGANGDAPNTDLWQGTKYASNSVSDVGDWEIQSNKLQFVISSNQVLSNLPSNFRFSGDFDIQIDFDIPSIPPSSYAFGIKLLDADMDADFISDNYAIFARYNASNGPYRANVTGGTPQLGGSEDLSGKFRITRSGSTVTYYRWSGGAWVQFGITQTMTTADVRFDFYAYTWTTNQSLTVNFSNFQINSGTIVWPIEGKNPDRKRVAFVQSDNASPLYAEIEQWDDVNKKAVFWVSNSDWVISASENTKINLLYDSSKRQNEYIGDLADTTSQNVWDSNFKGVWHLANLIDSTGNISELINQGALIVDSGKIADAYDFESSNTEYLYKNEAPVDSLPVTFQGWINLESATISAMVWVGDKDETNKWISISARDNYIGRMTLHNYGGSSSYDIESLNTFNGWGFLLGTIDADKNITMIVDADFDNKGTGAGTGAGTVSGHDRVAIGAALDSTPGGYADGTIDEVRISNIVRSDAWIKADYYAQLNQLLTVKKIK